MEIIYKILFETNFEGFKNIYGSEFEKLNYNCCFQTEDEELQEEEDRQKLLMDARVTFFSCWSNIFVKYCPISFSIGHHYRSGWLDKIFKTTRPLAELFNLPNIAIAFLRQEHDGDHGDDNDYDGEENIDNDDDDDSYFAAIW